MDINLCRPDKLLLDLLVVQMDKKFGPPKKLLLDQIDINLCLPKKLLLYQMLLNS